MWHLEKSTSNIISLSSHRFWSSADMSITLSRGWSYTEIISLHRNYVMYSDVNSQEEYIDLPVVLSSKWRGSVPASGYEEVRLDCHAW